MKIALACDHGGYEFTEKLIAFLTGLNHLPQHFGCYTNEACDYPDVAMPTAISIIEGHNERGILVCTTGIGMCITANKIPGIKAALVYDGFTAKSSRAHNNANILCLGAARFSFEELFSFVEIWLKTEFDCGYNSTELNATRHLRRVNKIDALESLDLALEADPVIDKLLSANAVKDFQFQINELEEICPQLLEQKAYWSKLEQETAGDQLPQLRVAFTKSMGKWELDLVPDKSLIWSIEQKINQIEARLNVLHQLLSQALLKQRTT